MLNPFSSLIAPIMVPSPGEITYKTKQTIAMAYDISHYELGKNGT